MLITEVLLKYHFYLYYGSAGILKILAETMQEYELDAAMAKATQFRANEKAKNTLIIQDAQDAQTAFAQMLLVFKEFHAKAAVATALVQQSDVLDAP